MNLLRRNPRRQPPATARILSGNEFAHPRGQVEAGGAAGDERRHSRIPGETPMNAPKSTIGGSGAILRASQQENENEI